jgi:uncharacterized protein (DUF362 family)
MKPRITRRTALALSAAAVTTSCARSTGSGAGSRPGSSTLVSINRAPSYNQDLYDIVRRILAEHKLDVRGKRVVLKPNLVEFDAATAINTHPMFVHAALEGFRALGAADVRLAEGPGHRRITLDLADAAGFFSTIPKFDSLFTDLNLDEVTEVKIPTPFSKLSSVYLPNTILGCDLLVSLPKMKTHHWAGATLSMKNMFGIVPGGVYGWPKNVLHWAGIDECIADLQKIIPKTFALVDGIVGMEGNGPIQGTPKASGLLVAGANFAAVDRTCCELMGIDTAQIAYLQLASAGRILITETGEDKRTMKQPFELLPALKHLRA